MAVYVRAVRGENGIVLELQEGLFAFVNGDACMFASNPDSFYKFGYFEKPDTVPKEMIRKALESIGKAVEELSEENDWQTCIGLSAGEIKKAWEALQP